MFKKIQFLYITISLLLFSTIAQAQFAEGKKMTGQSFSPAAQLLETKNLIPLSDQDTTKKVKIVPQDTNLKVEKVPIDTNSKKILVKDTTGHEYNQYKGLLNDDPIYNKRHPWWQPALKVVLQNVLLNLFDHYVLNLEFAVVGFNSWKHTANPFFTTDRWKWDEDRFGNNFLLHPLTGAGYYNSARASGMTFYESMPYAFGGSLMWKMFGENAGSYDPINHPELNGRPEREDILNTTILGIFNGEVLYRISSNILDDRTTGTERFFRELASGIIDPSRFYARLMQGKVTTVTTDEVYQKEPLDVVLSAGVQVQGQKNPRVVLNADFDYGDPFEKRDRKPFDYFTLRTDVTIGEGRKLITNISGEGVLYAKNMKVGNTEMLTGAFIHYDFWDSYNFELATMAFSGGIVSKLAVAPNTNLYTNFNLGIVPFAGNSREYGPDTSQLRDYYFSAGAEAKLEITLNYKGFVSGTLLAYYYWLNTIERPLITGRPGNDYIAILKPRLEFHLFNNIGIGIEHLIYMDDRVYTDNTPTIHTTKTQDKIFLLVYFADFLHNR